MIEGILGGADGVSVKRGEEFANLLIVDGHLDHCSPDYEALEIDQRSDGVIDFPQHLGGLFGVDLARRILELGQAKGLDSFPGLLEDGGDMGDGVGGFAGGGWRDGDEHPAKQPGDIVTDGEGTLGVAIVFLDHGDQGAEAGERVELAGLL